MNLRSIVSVTAFAGALIISGCGYKAIDASQVQTVQLRGGATTLPICGLVGEALPVVTARMADGKERVAGGQGDSGFDPKELAWTTNVGAINVPENGNASYAPPDDITPLVDNDVNVTLAFAKNANAKLAITLTPTFACPVVADFGMQAAQAGDNGDDGATGETGRSGGQGGNGFNGANGTDAAPLDVYLVVVQNAKRGPLVYASVESKDGVRSGYVFSARGGGITVINTGGPGGPGGFGGAGGFGGEGGKFCGSGGKGGHGGNGANGGNGGRGGSIVVHLDAAHPELEQLLKTDVRGGAGGPAGNGGNGGGGGSRTMNKDDGSTCDRNKSGDSGPDGEAGKLDGAVGGAGNVQVVREPAERMFPNGVKIGSLTVGKREKAAVATSTRGPFQNPGGPMPGTARPGGANAGPNAGPNPGQNAGPGGQKTSDAPRDFVAPSPLAQTTATGTFTTAPMQIANEQNQPVLEIRQDGSLWVLAPKIVKVGQFTGGVLAMLDGSAISLAKDGSIFSTKPNSKTPALGGAIDANGVVTDRMLGVVHIDPTGAISADKPRSRLKLHFVKTPPAPARASAGVLAGMALIFFR